jgi:hypothetical protein
MNDTKKTNWTSYKQQQRNLTLQADINRYRKQGHYLELIIAGLLGASAALGFVIIHQIFFV